MRGKHLRYVCTPLVMEIVSTEIFCSYRDYQLDSCATFSQGYKDEVLFRGTYWLQFWHYHSSWIMANIGCLRLPSLRILCHGVLRIRCMFFFTITLRNCCKRLCLFLEEKRSQNFPLSKKIYKGTKEHQLMNEKYR